MTDRALSIAPHPAYGLDWNLVRSFEAVASAGSLAGGARLLGIAHPTIARHVQNLEAELGLTLFARTKQGLALNEAGEQLLRAAGDMQTGALAFQNAVDTIADRAVPSVRVTVSEMLAELLPHLTMPSVNSVERTPPALEMLVTNAPLNLLDREADIAIRHARPTQQDLIARSLGALPVGLFASPNYVQQHGLLSNENANDHWFVDGASRAHLLQGARASGMEISPERVSFKSDALSCQRAAVVAGWGIGAFPSAIAANVDGLVDAMAPPPDVSLPVWLVARPEVRDNEQLKRVFDGIGEAFNDHLTCTSGQ